MREDVEIRLLPDRTRPGGGGADCWYAEAIILGESYCDASGDSPLLAIANLATNLAGALADRRAGQETSE